MLVQRLIPGGCVSSALVNHHKKSKRDFSVLYQVVLEDKQRDEANGFDNIWLEKQPILILVY